MRAWSFDVLVVKRGTGKKSETRKRKYGFLFACVIPFAIYRPGVHVLLGDGSPAKFEGIEFLP